jgi:acyl carrier protein
MSPLEIQLLNLITEVCRLPGVEPENYNPEAPLIGSDSQLGIDSLDAVEIVFQIQKNFSVHIDSEDTSRKVLATLRTLAEFVEKNRQ